MKDELGKRDKLLLHFILCQLLFVLLKIMNIITVEWKILFIPSILALISFFILFIIVKNINNSKFSAKDIINDLQNAGYNALAEYAKEATLLQDGKIINTKFKYHGKGFKVSSLVGFDKNSNEVLFSDIVIRSE